MTSPPFPPRPSLPNSRHCNSSRKGNSSRNCIRKKKSNSNIYSKCLNYWAFYSPC